MKIIIVFCCLISISTPHPISKSSVGDRCFAGGSLFKELNQTTGIGEICVKDDISIIKSTVSSYNDEDKTSHWIKFYRVYIVKDWHDCNPIYDKYGNFMVLEISEAGLMIPKMHTCRAQCDISLDKDNAEVVFSSSKINHYELAGTTVTNGWFKQSISVSLEHTCEHLTATCGQKTLRFHACFRQHRSCIRYFKNSYLPSRMVESMCQNLELLILTVFSFVAFCFAMIITRTYIAYLMIPLFYPITYIYGKMYSKYFKLCSVCMLAIHPFTNCSTTCICGSKFSTTEQVRVHRLCGCPGYKSLSRARAMCKSKTWSFISAISAGIFLFSFITPINAEKMYKLEELADDFIDMSQKLDEMEHNAFVNKMVLSIILSIVLALLITERHIFRTLFSSLYRNCSICNLIHYKPGLRFNSIVTNRCGTCVCGYSEHISEGDGYEIFIKDMHKQRESCKYEPFINHVRNLKIVIILLIVVTQLQLVLGEEKDCLKYPYIINKSNLSECFGLNLNITNCVKDPDTLYNTLKGENLVSEADKTDFKIINYKSEEAFEKIEMSQDLHKMILLEYIYYKGNCDKLNTMKSNAGPYNIPWRSFIKTHHLDACGQYPQKMICRCISYHKYCNYAETDALSQLQTYYQTHQSSYNMDLNTVLDALGMAFRGIGKILIENFMAESLINDMESLLNRMSTTLTTNVQLKGIIKYAIMLLKINNTRKARSSKHETFLITQEPDLRGNQFNGYSVHTEDVKICKEPSKLSCFSKRQRTMQNDFLLCKINNSWKIFIWPEKPTILTNDGLCHGDKHCHIPFPRLDEDTTIKQISCFKTAYTPNPSGMEQSAKKCVAQEVGICSTLDNFEWPMVLCKDGKHYHSDTREHARDGTIDTYCLSEKCKLEKYPVHKSYLLNCKWENTNREALSVKEFNHVDIESYRKAIESDIRTDLIIHNFRPTKDLPHIIPRYNTMTVQGTVYQDGLQNAFITGSLPAISGISAGYHLRAPDGTELFDIIIFLKKAIYKSRYTKIYTTGPTISINVQHDEQCTGQCPRNIPKQDGWLTFSKEHTSNWGCEEFGCLAVDSGCLYGSCQDVIRPEMDIYKKEGQEQSLLEICITTPHETFCNDLDILEPLIGDKIEVSFQTTQSNHMPYLIAHKKGKLFTGQINDLGNTAAMCGSVQMINGSLIGQGNPKFDYLCHAMKRKDVIVRRCYDNHYMTCNLLESRNDLVYNLKENIMTVSLSGNNLGLMNFKIMLGDINYKSFTQENNLDIRGQCAGCTNCAEEISCELTIISQGEVLCKVQSDCNLYISNILVKPNIEKYSLKLSCYKHVDSISITICNKEIVMPTILKQHQQKIDLSKLDESNYIKEEDVRCNTWLCKVKDEGIGFILDTLLGKIGKVWAIVIYVLLSLLIIFVFIYFIYPCCKRLRGVLEQNELEYIAEQKMK
ncbi:membrane glycoprotein polyprotein [Buttonwillow virus]|uniref:Envelopment polyprotein n=1 Tax=Buttonwillow virus TaxID=159140 RepID=A0A023VZY3_9VIRU|nr:membrane glycoprotein polyprotein [Buttonwillow virus]AHY22347.1 membrane glycoprotein polyprotein [Buttonwillow virus]